MSAYAILARVVTVLGSSGFVGRHIVAMLRADGIEPITPRRGESLRDRELGDVIDCVGLTADFRHRPLDTVEAHVGTLLELLRTTRCRSLVYCSSTRVYRRLTEPAREDAHLSVVPTDPDDLYDLSKLMGESLALSQRTPLAERPGIRIHVARISNVYGDDLASANFLSSVLRDVAAGQPLLLRASLASAKDYIHVADVARSLVAIALRGTRPIYNVASGENVSHRAIGEALRKLSGCRVEVVPGAPTQNRAPIQIDLLRNEFDIRPARLLDQLAGLLDLYRAHGGAQT